METDRTFGYGDQQHGDWPPAWDQDASEVQSGLKELIRGSSALIWADDERGLLYFYLLASATPCRNSIYEVYNTGACWDGAASPGAYRAHGSLSGMWVYEIATRRWAMASSTGQNFSTCVDVRKAAKKSSKNNKQKATKSSKSNNRVDICTDSVKLVREYRDKMKPASKPIDMAASKAEALDLMRPYPSGENASVCYDEANLFVCARVNVPAFRNQPLTWLDPGDQSANKATLFLLGGHGAYDNVLPLMGEPEPLYDLWVFQPDTGWTELSSSGELKKDTTAERVSNGKWPVARYHTSLWTRPRNVEGGEKPPPGRDVWFFGGMTLPPSHTNPGKPGDHDQAWGVVDALWRYHYIDAMVLGEWTLITGSDAVMHDPNLSEAVPMVQAAIDKCDDAWPLTNETFQDSRCPPGTSLSQQETNTLEPI